MNHRPTRIRYWVLFAVCLVYLITYLDRVCISVAAPLISAEFHLSKIQWGFVLSVFSWTYACFQIPVGALSDRRGARSVLAVIVAFWSVMTAMTAVAWNFGALLIIRLLFGAGEAGAFPTATRAFSHWIPATERGLAQGVTHACARLGGALTPLLVAAIMARWGWRSVFYAFSTLGLCWSGAWYFWFRNTPLEFRERWGQPNQAEIALIKQGAGEPSKHKLRLKILLKSRNMWFLCFSFATYCYTIWIFLTWLPSYLVEARGFSIMKMGVFASVPLLAGTIGDSLGGWISDRIWRQTNNGKFARRVVAMSGMTVAAVVMIPGVMTSSPYMAVFYLACSLVGLEMAVGVYWAVCLDVGHEYAGTVSGMMNTMGGIGSALSPLVFGTILQLTGSWVYPFFVASGLLLVGVILWLKVNPELALADELLLGKEVGPASQNA